MDGRFVSTPGAPAKYLLSGGMLKCPTCGGRFEACNARFYVCGTRRKSGSSVCSNTLSLRIDVFDQTVLGLLEGHVLHPRFIDQVCDLACGNTADVERDEVEQRRTEAETRLKNLSAFIEKLGPADTPEEYFDRVKTLRAERDALSRRLEAMDAPADRAQLRVALEQRCEDWRQRLRGDHPDEARFVVQKLIGPITLWEGDEQRLSVEQLAAFGVVKELPPDVKPSREGTDEIPWEDCGFSAVVTPAGLIDGLNAKIMVAGAGFEPATFGL